ncbi:hypothetical protein JI739_05470 [Ramlibacter sp. AW1]|uniref:Uncharacterized protein n=1 Tax=Ramlibacter aurantiacus TaxID=2801330 RepID=A0A937D0T6_9BURK|nr:hypothetical protein [Ramlibacter aurantiacus]MBL0419794.1 hypothetical protein [Ramlibacter aurantiacus]
MTTKELAYSAQQHLQASTGGPFKRAHIYELLAASFGFKSYAALGVDAVFTQQRPDDERTASHSAFVRRRCIELGLSPESADLVSVTLGAFLAERQIGVVRISALIGHLRGDWSSPDDYPIGVDTERFGDEQNDGRAPRWPDGDEGDFAPLMLEGLEAAASKGNALAHYALALIHAPDEEDADQKTGSSYWHSQAQQGRVLTGVEKEWADAHAGRLTQAERYGRHLREAGRLGNQHALLDLAERFGDPSFFEQPHHDVGADPSAVAEIAERLGRVTDAKHWLTVAAESGDTDAMLRLIEEHDQSDLARCWTWVYLSRLVGTDLSKDAHYAINEDGSEYDDDVGGAAYVAGRDGVDLDPLSAEQDAAAKKAAQDLFERIQQAAAAEPGR